jgi:hypothetical protein
MFCILIGFLQVHLIFFSLKLTSSVFNYQIHHISIIQSPSGVRHFQSLEATFDIEIEAALETNCTHVDIDCNPAGVVKCMWCLNEQGWRLRKEIP